MATLAGASLATQILVGSSVAAAATGIGSTVAQMEAGRKAERQQEKAAKIERTGAAVEAARQRRRAIAQARIAQAQNVAAQGEAIQSSSAEAGVQSSLITQLGANIGAQLGGINRGRGVQRANQRAANAIQSGRNQAGFFNAGQQIAGIGMQMAGSNFLGGGQNTQNLAPEVPFLSNAGFGQV